MIPALQEVFSPLTPSFDRFKVDFGDKGPCYCAGGTIYLSASMDFESPAHRYGGLFHETVHGFVEKYIHRPQGTNVHPSEALAIILQVAALYKVNREWASKYEQGHGSSESVQPWLKEFGRVFDEAGFEPIRAIHRAMGDSLGPVFTSKATYMRDVNRLWGQLGYSCRLTLDETEGLTDG
jgi:hypothetical protein